MATRSVLTKPLLETDFMSTGGEETTETPVSATTRRQRSTRYPMGESSDVNSTRRGKTNELLDAISSPLEALHSHQRIIAGGLRGKMETTAARQFFPKNVTPFRKIWEKLSKEDQHSSDIRMRSFAVFVGQRSSFAMMEIIRNVDCGEVSTSSLLQGLLPSQVSTSSLLRGLLRISATPRRSYRSRRFSSPQS